MAQWQYYSFAWKRWIDCDAQAAARDAIEHPGDGVRLVAEEDTVKVAELLTANLEGSTWAQMASNMRKERS